jgi:hypothetical protein
MVPLWTEHPTILLKQDQLVFWPVQGMTSHEKLNAISRLVILLSLVGFIVSSSFRFVFIGIVTLGCIVGYSKYMVPPQQEPFTQKVENHTVPTEKNPMMNVLLPELNGNPNRKPALLSYTPKTHKDINNKVKRRMPADAYKGVNDEMDLEYSMRQFYTTANTTVPNDQEGFGQFCYGNMASGKEGDKNALLGKVSRLGPIFGN